MRNVRERGIALGLVLVGIAVISIIIGIAARSSILFLDSSKQSSEGRRMKIQALSRFYQMKDHFLKNLALQVKMPGVQAIPESFYAPYRSFNPPRTQDEGQLVTNIRCFENCDFSDAPNTFPKKFFADLTYMGKEDKSQMTTVRGIWSFHPVGFNDFSTLVLGSMKDKILISAGKHHRAGFFFNFADRPAGAPAPQLQFLPPQGQTTEIAETFYTNLEPENVFFGPVSCGVFGTCLRNMSGEVQAGGFATGASIPPDPTANLIALAAGAPYKGQNSYGDISLGGGGFDNSVKYSEIKMSATNMKVLDHINDAAQTIKQVYPLQGNPDSFPPPGTVISLSAPKVIVNPYGAVSGNSIKVPKSAQVTFVSEGPFEPSYSIDKEDDATTGGSIAYINIGASGAPAAKITPTMKSLQGNTLSSIAGNVNPVTATNKTLQLDGVWVSLNGPAFELDGTLVASGTVPTGALHVDGSLISAEVSNLRYVDTTTGNVASGFNTLEQTYSPHYLYKPPPGLATSVSGDYVIDIVGLRIDAVAAEGFVPQAPYQGGGQ